MDLLPKYITFKVSFVKFPVVLPINEHSPHNYEQFSGCLVKIKQILSILQGFNIAFDFPVFLNWAIFSVDVFIFKISYVNGNVFVFLLACHFKVN